VGHEKWRRQKGRFSDISKMNIKDQYKKLINQNIKWFLSLTSVAAKLSEGLEPSCLPKFTPVMSSFTAIIASALS